jgi:hypothetical protein
MTARAVLERSWLLLLTVLLPAQAPRVELGPRIAEALRQGDHVAAEVLVASEPELPQRALFEAALRPLPERPAALLAVAQRFPDDAVARRALLAGLAAALVLERRWPDALPPLPDLMQSLGDALHPHYHGGPSEAGALAVVVPQLLAQARREFGERPDSAETPLLRHLARLVSGTARCLEPRRIAPNVPWPLPRPLAEDLLVSTWRLGDAAPTELDLLAVLEHDCDRRWWIRAADPPAELQGPGPGRWLVEVQSLVQPWRSWRVVEVGSLAATVLSDEGAMVLVAHDGGQLRTDAAVAWTAWDGSRPRPGTLRGGHAVWQRPAAGACTVQVRVGDERARVAAWVPAAAAAASAPQRECAVAHWQFDRPLHRPGEVLHGRVVVRSVQWTGEGLAAVPTSQVPAPQQVPLRCQWPAGDVATTMVELDPAGVATFAITVPESAQPGAVRVELGPLAGGAVLRTVPTSIASFRRPAMVATLTGPSQLGRTESAAQLQLTVRWASGGPAVAVPVEVEAATYDHTDAWQGATDEQGGLVIPLVWHARRSGCFVTCRVHGSDGHVETLTHTVQLAEAMPAATAAWGASLALDVDGEVVVGKPATLRVRGANHAAAILVIGRGEHARVQPLQFDASGLATPTVAVLAADWPRFDALVINPGAGRPVTATAPVRLGDPVPLRLEVPATALPQQAVRCRALAAPGSVVTFAVVDDRVFRLADDPTRAPADALRPAVPPAAWRAFHSLEALDPRALLGELLVAGRVPGPGEWQPWPTPSGGSMGGGPSSPGAAPVGLRADFRATACFRTVRADAAGVAELGFDLPADATTWRVTATAVDGHGEGGLATATIAARLPLAAEPQLPRVLRVGDRVEVPLLLDRAAMAAARPSPVPDAVHYAVVATGEAHLGGLASGSLPLPPGCTALAGFSLAADAVGEVVLGTHAAVAGDEDRAERRVPVLPTAVAQTVASVAAGRGELSLAAPERLLPGTPLQVEVMAGGAAAWHELAARLEAYPYGCVEQTLSRLLPFAAARVVGTDPQRRADRIGKGMARLRQLQRGAGGPFAWWPDGEVDLGMTGLVLHGLAALRGAGIAAAEFGLRVDGAVLRAAARCDGERLPPSLPTDVIELLSGLLRYLPDDATTRALAAAIVDAKGPLPRGGALRLGLALLAAGDRDRALRCRQAGAAVAAGATRFPGEDPTVIKALELEFDRALGAVVDPAAEAALVRELLGAACRTYTDAVALLALAPGLRAPAAALEVEVAIDGGAARTLPLPAGPGARATLAIPAGGRNCRVRCRDAGELLFVRVLGQASRPGIGPGWAAPFHVERTLSGPGVAAGDDGVPVLRVGERVHVRLQLTTTVRADYVSLQCPLPTGCEVLDEAPSLQRFDDRVVMAWPHLVTHRPAVVEFDLVATLPGVVAWPSALAEAMYEPELHGGSTGTLLRIERQERRLPAPAAAPRPLVANPAPLPAPEPAVPEPAPPTLAERAEDAADLLHDAWFAGISPGALFGFEPAPDAETQAAIAAACERLHQVLPHEADAVLQALTELGSIHGAAPRGGALAPWQRDLLERLADLREQCLDRVVAQSERWLGSEDQHWALASVLERLPAPRREALAVRVLATAWPQWPDLVESVVEVLEPPVHDERLLALLAVMATGAPGSVPDGVLTRLPRSRLAMMPPTALCELALQADDFDLQGSLLQLVGRLPAARRELLVRAREPGCLESVPAWRWPDEVLAALPESALAAVAELDPARAVRVLATGPMATATLWEHVRQRGGGLPLEVVVAALRSRAALPPAAFAGTLSSADPTVAAIGKALDAMHDPAAATAVLASVQPLLVGGADLEPALQQVVGDLVARHGSIDDVLACSEWLLGPQWQVIWPRLSLAEAMRVVAHPRRVGYGMPATEAALAALLQAAAARHQLDEAVAALLTVVAGEERLLALMPTLPPPLRDDVAGICRQRFGFDTGNGAAPMDLGGCVVGMAQLRGHTAVWPAHLVPARDHLLALRGLF